MPKSMSSTDVLRQAIERLGLDHLVEAQPRERGLHRLQVASVAAGAAEGQAILYAAEVMRTAGGESALDTAQDLAFRATRMLARDERTGEVLWCLWTLRRLVHRLARARERAPDDHLEAAGAALHAVHAFLSASLSETEPLQSALRAEAAQGLDRAAEHLESK
ncbi:hypothetical protein LWC35_19470 [Pseudonocardia kujensis]|uniref:hypothetical protein n=1 Tax=Pseudonocardia kujensis TaxID=1128675 RepID=UPI001E3DEA6C|nr:hypothetical protein [Pseudonocardia kujensis]MCE0765060.1 hypothetical protein [Pseudonocardia kujensis]